MHVGGFPGASRLFQGAPGFQGPPGGCTGQAGLGHHRGVGRRGGSARGSKRERALNALRLDASANSLINL